MRTLFIAHRALPKKKGNSVGMVLASSCFQATLFHDDCLRGQGLKPPPPSFSFFPRRFSFPFSVPYRYCNPCGVILILFYPFPSQDYCPWTALSRRRSALLLFPYSDGSLPFFLRGRGTPCFKFSYLVPRKPIRIGSLLPPPPFAPTEDFLSRHSSPSFVPAPGNRCVFQGLVSWPRSTQSPPPLSPFF